MKLVSAGGQQTQHPLYCFDGTITTGGTAQLALARSMSRSLLILENNNASGNLLFEFGSARATSTITSGVVTSTSITNAGFNFGYPPVIRFLGGGSAGNPAYKGLAQPNGATPSNQATGHAVLTAGALSSIVIDNGGSGYVTAPYVFIQNSELDPNGCAVPSATVGILLVPGGGALTFNGTCCPTDSIAVFGATTSMTFVVRWMD
jgi:hypothetical protein